MVKVHEDADAEDIRKRKMGQEAAIQKLKAALRIALDDNAYERMSNVYAVNKTLFVQAAQKMVMAFQRVERKLTEKEAVIILDQLRGGSSEGTISIRRK